MYSLQCSVQCIVNCTIIHSEQCTCMGVLFLNVFDTTLVYNLVVRKLDKALIVQLIFSFIFGRFARGGACAKSWGFYVYLRSLKWQCAWFFSGSYNKARNSAMCGSCHVVCVTSDIQPDCCHCASWLIFIWIWLDKCLRWGQYFGGVVSKTITLQLHAARQLNYVYVLHAVGRNCFHIICM